MKPSRAANATCLPNYEYSKEEGWVHQQLRYRAIAILHLYCNGTPDVLTARLNFERRPEDHVHRDDGDATARGCSQR
jgi:hypothetical protein